MTILGIYHVRVRCEYIFFQDHSAKYCFERKSSSTKGGTPQSLLCHLNQGEIPALVGRAIHVIIIIHVVGERMKRVHRVNNPIDICVMFIGTNIHRIKACNPVDIEIFIKAILQRAVKVYPLPISCV